MNTKSGIQKKAMAGEALEDVLIIDIHVHWGKWLAVHAPSAEERMVEKMDRVGISKLCINGTLHPDVVEGNDRVAAAIQRHPEKLIAFAALNPYHPTPMIDERKRCVEVLGMKGLKLHQGVSEPRFTPFPIDPLNREWTKVWDYLSGRNIPVLFHGVVTDDVIAGYPGINFVTAHGVGSPETFRRRVQYSNLHAETASTQNQWWYMDDARKVLDPERILWGTDAPFDDFAQRFGIVLDSDLTEDEQRKVLGGNAARLVKL